MSTNSTTMDLEMSLVLLGTAMATISECLVNLLLILLSLPLHSFDNSLVIRVKLL